MTPRDLRNIHNTGNSCRDTLPYMNMALKLPRYFTCWWRSLLVTTSKFGQNTFLQYKLIVLKLKHLKANLKENEIIFTVDFFEKL